MDGTADQADPALRDSSKPKPKEDKNVQDMINEFSRAARACSGNGASTSCTGSMMALVQFEQMESLLRYMFNSVDYGQSRRGDKSDDENSEDSSDSE